MMMMMTMVFAQCEGPVFFVFVDHSTSLSLPLLSMVFLNIIKVFPAYWARLLLSRRHPFLSVRAQKHRDGEQVQPKPYLGDCNPTVGYSYSGQWFPAAVYHSFFIFFLLEEHVLPCGDGVNCQMLLDVSPRTLRMSWWGSGGTRVRA